MRVVAALGGNALLQRGQPLDTQTQRRNARTAATALAEVAAGHGLLVTHGNGPQVGLLALQSATLSDAAPTPLDVLDAESEGMVGYIVEQELGASIGSDYVVTVLTQTVVDADDPAFDAPTKPIGPLYDEATARSLVERHGWDVARDGSGWRRVVASPEPRAILELQAIETLLEAEMIVVCAGGGVPVVRRGGRLEGIEAVVDATTAAPGPS